MTISVSYKITYELYENMITDDKQCYLI